MLSFRIACPECDSSLVLVDWCIPPNPERPDKGECERCHHVGDLSSFMLPPTGDHDA